MTSIESLEQVTNEISEDILLCGHTHLPYLSTMLENLELSKIIFMFNKKSVSGKLLALFKF